MKKSAIMFWLFCNVLLDQVVSLKAQVCDQQCCGAGHQWSGGLPISGVTCKKPVPGTP